MGSTSRMPTLRADRVIGHAATDRMHRRDKPEDDPAAGMRVRKRLSAPATDLKKRRTRGSTPR